MSGAPTGRRTSKQEADETAPFRQHRFPQLSRSCRLERAARYRAGEWQQVTFRFNTPESTANARVYALVASGTCDLTWDDFSLTRVAE